MNDSDEYRDGRKAVHGWQGKILARFLGPTPHDVDRWSFDYRTVLEPSILMTQFTVDSDNVTSMAAEARSGATPRLLCMRKGTRICWSSIYIPRDLEEQVRENAKMGTIKHYTIQGADYADHSRIASP